MTAQPILQAVAIEKSFGATRALKGVTIALQPGEVHAIVGENGAGKSTLTKILAGVIRPDLGEVVFDGETVELSSPMEARARGILCVHQELELAPTLSVAENIFLGAPLMKGVFVDRSRMKERAVDVLRALGATINPDAIVRDLNIPDRQIVEIARALVRSANVLLLDEPTAALSPFEAAKLLELVRRLREQSVAVVYISHRLDEVMEIADRISVLRDGCKVAELRPGEATRERLVAQILGQELAVSHFDKLDDCEANMVEVEALGNGRDLHGVTFGVPKGQTIGFFGLLGAGQNSVAKSLFGLDSRSAAKRCLIEESEGLPSAPQRAIARSIGYVPADRRQEGLALGLSILENVLLASMQRLTRFGFVRRRLARQLAQDLMTRFDVRMGGLDQPVGHLSGGNQQKVVLAKWAAAGARILLLEEPTRGIDVGAKAEIYRNIREFVQRGDRCCLLFSSDAEEVAIACDAAFVLREGRIAARLGAANLSATRLIKEALG